jgi:PLP dependent protein
MSIDDRLSKIQEAIQLHAGDRPVTLVAVSKYATLEQMQAAYEAGVRHFGENKVQDALAKMEQLPPEINQNIHWHFIGHLQANKVKKTVNCFNWIHTVDSIRLAETISRHNLAVGLVQPVLLQINLSDDPARHGFLKDEVTDALLAMKCLEGISVRGLMGMAPQETSLASNETELKNVFCGLRALRDHLQHSCKILLPELSMGMSHDFTHALRCGATIIRIGNYLFKN